jgi:hypothetical protein
MNANQKPPQSMAGSRKKNLFQDKTNNDPQFIIAKQINPGGKPVNQKLIGQLHSQTIAGMYQNNIVNNSGISNYSNTVLSVSNGKQNMTKQQA